METKSFGFKLDKALTEEGEFSGYLSVFNVEDSWGDMVMPGAFKKTLKENDRFPLLNMHNMEEILGDFEAEEDKKGLYINAALELGIAKAKEKYLLLKKKILKGLSIGFKTIKDKWEDKIRQLLEVQLWEGSLVTYGANPEALVDAVKIQGGPEEILRIIDILKGRKTLSAEHRGIITKARDEINALIESNEPPEGTRKDTLSPYASIIEGLEAMKNKPRVHLFGRTIETLEQNL